MDEEVHAFQSLAEEHHSKPRRASSSSSRKKSISEDFSKVKGRDKGEKRSKRRKSSDVSKKMKKEDSGVAKGKNPSRNSSATPDSELRQDQLDSPIVDDVFEGSSSSQESSDLLSMSSLLKSILDHKKMRLLESHEIQQFLIQHVIKKEKCEDGGN